MAEGSKPKRIQRKRPLLIHQIKKVTALIEAEVSYFNGWAVSETTMRKNCEQAAVHVLRYLRKEGLANG